MSGLVWTCLAIGRTCPVRTDPLGKMSINHVILIKTLSNLTQGYSSTLGRTFSRIMTSIIGYKSRLEKIDMKT
jgi:hypothetical protein